MQANIRKRAKSKRPAGSVYRTADLGDWAKYFDCTQQEIRDAVTCSGVMIVDINDWIKRNVVRRISPKISRQKRK